MQFQFSETILTKFKFYLRIASYLQTFYFINGEASIFSDFFQGQNPISYHSFRWNTQSYTDENKEKQGKIRQQAFRIIEENIERVLSGVLRIMLRWMIMIMMG